MVVVKDRSFAVDGKDSGNPMTRRRTPLREGTHAGLLSGGSVPRTEGEQQQGRNEVLSDPLCLGEKLPTIGERESVVMGRPSLVRFARLERGGGGSSFVQAAPEKGRRRGQRQE